MNKEGWEVKKLGEVADSFIGLTYKPEDVSDDGTIVLRSGNIQNDKIDLKDLVRVNTKISTKHFIKDGDILMCSRNGSHRLVGKCVLIDNLPEQMSFGAFMTVIRSELNKYLLYFFKSSSFRYQLSSAKTSTINQITISMLKSILVRVPYPSIQEQIVKELDLLNDIIAKEKEQLTELDTLAQATFYHMFGDPVDNEKGWRIEKLENACVSIVRGPFGSSLKKEFFVPKSNSTYKVYEQKHAIQKNETLGNYYIDEELYNSLNRFTVYPQDIIMSCSGTIGEFFEIPYNAEKGIINQALLKFTLKQNEIRNIYFLFIMKQLIVDIDRKGSGIQNIGSVKFIKNIRIGIPPLSLQNQFAERIEAIEKQKELINNSIKDVQQLFDYTMDKYFN